MKRGGGFEGVRINPPFSVRTKKFSYYQYCSRTKLSVFTAFKKIISIYVGALDRPCQEDIACDKSSMCNYVSSHFGGTLK